MKKPLQIYLNGLLVILLILSTICSKTKRVEQEFRVGLIAPITGKLEGIGTSVLEGARLAVDEKNSNGGIEVEGIRYRVVTVIKDCQDLPECAVSVAQELINRENVSAIIGPPISGLAIPVGKIASRAFVPMITQMATHPDVTRGTMCVFHVCFTDDFQGKIMARFVREELDARSAAVLFDIACPYNRGIAQIFKQSFEEFGGKVVAFEMYTTREDDFIDQLVRIRKSGPDVLFLPNYPYDIILQMEQIRELGLKTQIIGSDTMSFRNLEDIPCIEGAFFSTHYSNEIPSQKVKELFSTYQSAFGRMPTIGVVLTYDSFGLLFRAIESQNSIDPELICKGLAEIEGYEGVSGVISFSGSPDPEKSVVILHVKNGRFRYYTQIKP